MSKPHKTIHFKVTKKHIAEAEATRNNYIDEKYCSRCPVARAIRARGYKKVTVGFQYADFGSYEDVRLPPIAANAITSFDSRCKVEPFEFNVTVAAKCPKEGR
jgi:hypothetical protein